MQAGEFNRRIRFQRASRAHNGLEMVDTWADHGSPIWAGRKDVSDAERAAAGWVEATVVSRFTVRSSSFTRGLTAKDRLICGDLSFDIVGIKETARRDQLEITGLARADRG